MNSTKTVLDISENLEAVLCYVLGWLTGFIFLILEKKNTFVRFHAMQSIITFIGLFILSTITRFIPAFQTFFNPVINILSIALWLFLMYKAYLGEKYKLPLIGPWIEQQLDSTF